MDCAVAHLVHTEEAAPVESTGSVGVNGASEPGSRSSAGERLLHTQDVTGSIPVATTTPATRRRPVVSGIYLLFLKGRLIYVGQSRNCAQRVVAHRTNGREFDHSLIAPCPEDALDWLEAAMIAALSPEQNKAKPPVPTRALPPPPDMLSASASRDIAIKQGVRGRDFNAALASGEIPSFARGAVEWGAGSQRLVSRADLESWCAARRAARLHASQNGRTP